MRASEPGRFGLASCHASSMVISLPKRIFSVGALPAVIRSRTWPTRRRASTWSSCLPAALNQVAEALARVSLMDASHMLPNAKIVSNGPSGFEPQIEWDLLSPR